MRCAATSSFLCEAGKIVDKFYYLFSHFLIVSQDEQTTQFFFYFTCLSRFNLAVKTHGFKWKPISEKSFILFISLPSLLKISYKFEYDGLGMPFEIIFCTGKPSYS